MEELKQAVETFDVLKEYVDPSDIDSAAKDVVDHLVDAGYDPADIRETCEGSDCDTEELESALDAYGSEEVYDDEDMSDDMDDDMYDDEDEDM
jgi:hypothetical protein